MFQRTTVILFGFLGVVQAVGLLIFVGMLSDSMIVREIRHLIANPKFKDPYGLDLEDFMAPLKFFIAFGWTVLLASIFGILGMFILI